MIVRMSPDEEEKVKQADQAWFESDAATNADAIREIDTAAAARGLVRTREYWLQTFTLPDGRVVRRGFCYRPEPSDRVARVAGRRGSEMEGTDSATLVRQMREAE